MIHGYPARASVAPGERLVLHVAADAPTPFRVVFYRWGDGYVRVHESGRLAATAAPAKGAADDWQWPAYEFAMPSDWRPGVYVAHFAADRGIPFHPAMTSAAALFVVRGEGTGGLLYKLPLATYHAYNQTGGGCFYDRPPPSPSPRSPGSKVSLRRPGGGIGGATFGAPDHYDAFSPRNTFAHWDAPFIRWLLRNGYAPEFCTDFDLHADADLLPRYRLVVSAGHDEYWSETMRERVEAFAAAGGNLAFFAGNVCWWRIHVVDDGGAIVCHQGGPQGALDHWWPPSGAGQPEDSLTGVSYRHGGGCWDGSRRPAGFAVIEPEHWAFAGTGLAQGDVFGRDAAPPLVGYECDGAPLARLDTRRGVALLSPSAPENGTPPDFRVLAVCPLDDGWQELPAREGQPAGQGIHAATMGAFSPGGTVFTAATTDWPQVLASGQDPRVGKITRNVLDRLLLR